ncbi:hypothetical protein GCM10017687_28470 [Streptomyces echinatus]|uniref:phage tail fiber protein n=1 Tax=Streptomyces echinatus TaxID=67293 RepID=UPI00337DF330
MADNLTNTAENRALDWILGGSPTAPTTPLKVALVTAAGDACDGGTEVTGGGYAPADPVRRRRPSLGPPRTAPTWCGRILPSSTVVGVECGTRGIQCGLYGAAHRLPHRRRR